MSSKMGVWARILRGRKLHYFKEGEDKSNCGYHPRSKVLYTVDNPIVLTTCIACAIKVPRSNFSTCPQCGHEAER